MDWTLHFLGVGNADATASLGSAAAVVERGGLPLLMIDCGEPAFDAYLAAYGELPMALFLTHAHMDHVAGLARLFYAAYFDPARRGRVRLHVPVGVVPMLHARLADDPGVLAEGGANFWDAFQLVPVSTGFWWAGWYWEVFPVRHHRPGTAFGLRLGGSLVWTGDTRPIPEVLAAVADAGELVAHDCGLVANPSHSGIEELEREYPQALLSRCLFYHYGSRAEGAAMQERGHRVAKPGQRYRLASPSAERVTAPPA